MSEITKRTSFYKTVLVDGNKEFDYLSTPLPDLTYKKEDVSYIVTQSTVGRLDLISMRFYKTPDLWWLIAHVNNIIDPFDDMFVGQELRIPSHIDYYQFFINNNIIDEIEGSFEERGLDLNGGTD